MLERDWIEKIREAEETKKLKSEKRKSREAEKPKAQGQRSREAKKQEKQESREVEKGKPVTPQKKQNLSQEKKINNPPFLYTYPAPCGLLQCDLVEKACRLPLEGPRSLPQGLWPTNEGPQGRVARHGGRTKAQT